MAFSSPDEPMKLLPVKVSGSLEQALKKLDLSSKEQPTVQGTTGTGEKGRKKADWEGKGFVFGICVSLSELSRRICRLQPPGRRKQA